MTPSEAQTRPRVEGDRELEILEATLEVLADVGYDRLTMDAVAGRAKASKATLYRRWSGKADLVVEALTAHRETPPVPDTGRLRDDLLEAYCGLGGVTDPRFLAILAAVVTAMGRDEEFATIYRRDFIAPKQAAMRTILERAVARGEVSERVDLDLLAPALPGIVLHRVLLLGDEATPELVARVIDHIIVPAATAGAPTKDTP